MGTGERCAPHDRRDLGDGDGCPRDCRLDFLPRIPSLAWTVALAGVTSCAIGIVALDWTDLAEIGLLYLFAAYALIVGVLFAIVCVLLLRSVRR